MRGLRRVARFFKGGTRWNDESIYPCRIPWHVNSCSTWSAGSLFGKNGITDHEIPVFSKNYNYR